MNGSGDTILIPQQPPMYPQYQQYAPNQDIPQYNYNPQSQYNQPPLYNQPKLLDSKQQETIQKLKNFAEDVLKDDFSIWKNLGERSSASNREDSSSGGIHINYVPVNIGSNNNSSRRDRRERKEDNSAMWIAIVGAVIAIVGAIGLARADKRLDEIKDDTNFITKFKDNNDFNQQVGADSLQREYCAVMKNARVIRDNLMSDVQSRRLKAIGLIVAGALMVIGSLFALAFAAKVGIVLAIGVGVKYIYDLVRGDTSEKNKKIAQKILNVIQNLQIQDLKQSYEASAPFLKWDLNAPTWDQIQQGQYQQSN